MSNFDNDSTILTIKSGITVYTGKVTQDHFPLTIRKNWREIVSKSLTNIYKTHEELGLVGTDTPSIISNMIDQFFQINFILDSTHAYIAEKILIPLEKSIINTNKLVEDYEAKISDLTKKYEDKVAECEQLKKKIASLQTAQPIQPANKPTNLFIELIASLAKEAICPQTNQSQTNTSDQAELLTSLGNSDKKTKSYS